MCTRPASAGRERRYLSVTDAAPRFGLSSSFSVMLWIIDFKVTRVEPGNHFPRKYHASGTSLSRELRDSCALKYYAAVSDMASPQRLLLQALLVAMGDAVRRNDESVAHRYHRRLGMIARHFDTNPLISDALERLLSAGGRWLATNTAERYESEQQVLEHIQSVMDLI
jgi:hypothetical protein